MHRSGRLVNLDELDGQHVLQTQVVAKTTRRGVAGTRTLFASVEDETRNRRVGTRQADGDAGAAAPPGRVQRYNGVAGERRTRFPPIDTGHHVHGRAGLPQSIPVGIRSGSSGCGAR